MSKEAARKWYRQAIHDLEMAKKNIEIGGYDVSAFLCHQCIEKLLKAGFILEGRNVPKTHFIDELARELNLPEELQDKIMELTVDYTLSRYPDVSEEVPYEQYSKEIAMQKVKIATEVLNYFKKRWGEP
ncbi:MAG: HEPN domain-containing protein [Caldimicrobium sp.]